MNARIERTWQALFASAVDSMTKIANDPGEAQLLPVCLGVSRVGEVKIAGLGGANPRLMGDALAAHFRDQDVVAAVIVMESTTTNETMSGLGDAAVIHGVCGTSSRTQVYEIDRSRPAGDRVAFTPDAEVPAYLTSFLREALDAV